MKISKDLYEYLAEFTDDKTIVKMLSVNKKFNNSVFFQRIFNKKYPFLTEFKEDNETWKDFYLSMVKYISNLENYDIPYIPTEGYNPKDFYLYMVEYISKMEEEWPYLMAEGVGPKNHYIKIYNEAMEWAAIGENMEIVKLMIEKGANDFNSGMACSADEGHMEMVKLMIEKGAYNFNNSMRSAAIEGHMEIVKLMIEKGANNFNGGAKMAAIGENMEIVKLMIEKGADDFNSIMEGAIYRYNKFNV